MTPQVETPILVPLSEIYSDDEFNCRGAINPTDVVTLWRSIEELGTPEEPWRGLQQPIHIQPFTIPGDYQIKYRIISGHRRYMAHRVGNQDKILAFVKHNFDERAARKWNFEENRKRKDLNMVQEARHVAYYRNAGWTIDEIARELGESRMWVDVRIKILDLPPEVQKEIAAGFLTQEQIKDLSRVKDRKKLFDTVKLIKEAKINNERRKFHIVDKKLRPLAKKIQSPSDIRKMRDHLQKTFGQTDFAAKIAAWAAGDISTFAVHKAIKDLITERGGTYEIPSEILEAVI